MKKTFIIVLFFISLLTFGQVSDDFSDGNHTINPIWTPSDPIAWTDTLMRLRSNSKVLNSSFYITTPSTKALNAEWEFVVNLQFNTSSANYVDVYLASQQANLSSVTNSGYFVRIGGTPDEISLYKITAGTATLLINGTDGITNSSNNTLRIKVTRNAANLWSLQRDISGGTNFIEEGTATENSFITSAFFGIKIQQSTATFFNKHFFDDFFVGEIGQDHQRPALVSVEAINSTAVKLVFSEAVEIVSAQNISNYVMDNLIGHPASVSLLPDGKSVQLNFETRLTNGGDYSLTIQGVKDIAGNTSLYTEKPFRYFIAVPSKAKDILITEIMADPTPVVRLPEAEFIEIYNRSENAIDLAGWKFSDATGSSTLSSVILLPNSFLILTSTANASKFSTYGKTIGISSFPSLNNDGELLTLKNANGKTIDSLHYNLNWYKDDEKKDGGWSLELIDPVNICGEGENWVASEDKQGGSPGKLNSVAANKPDLTGPKLQRVSLQNSKQLLFTFDEKLQKAIDLNSFRFSPALEAERAFFTDLSLRTIQLNLVHELVIRQLYDIHLINVYDCNGNTIQEEYSRAQIALPEPADSLDLLINELLFNPRTGGVDFVEIYNNSKKFINLKNFKLGNYKDGMENEEEITPADFLLMPAQYLVLTEDIAILKNHYPQGDKKRFLEMDLPSLPDDEGSVAIASDGKIIDHLTYSSKDHSPLIKDEEGVSLERISFTQPTDDAANWRSATAAAGYATPGFINSNTRSGEQTGTTEVEVSPEIFSMEMPGNDFARIQYKFEESGYIVNVKIYDQQGRAIKEIVNNGTIGYDGAFRWDGDRDDGTKANSGYYLVWFEAFNTNGTLKTFRKRVIIAAR